MTNLECIFDKGELIFDNIHNLYKCRVCQSTFSVNEGVIIFVKEKDDFYEGVYNLQIRQNPKKDNILSMIPLWLVNSGYLYYVKQNFVRDSELLDLGCASGVPYFASRFNISGADVSYSALKNSAKIYKGAYQVDVMKKLPFQDGSFDGIISSFFWEHMNEHQKHTILKECSRVLKPGGKILFLFDVETENKFISILKRKNTKLYTKLFKENDGHIGYHSIKKNESIFFSNNFHILKSQGFEKTIIQSPSVYKKAVSFGGLIGAFSQMIVWLDKSKLQYLHIVITRVADYIFTIFVKKSKSRILMIVAEKSN